MYRYVYLCQRKCLIRSHLFLQMSSNALKPQLPFHGFSWSLHAPWFSPLTACVPHHSISLYIRDAFHPLHVRSQIIQNIFHSILPSPIWCDHSPCPLHYQNIYPLFQPLLTHSPQMSKPFQHTHCNSYNCTLLITTSLPYLFMT